MAATALPRGQAFDMRARQAFIEDQLRRYIGYRYDSVFMRDVNFGYEVHVDYDPTAMSHKVALRSKNGFKAALLVAEDRIFDVRDNEDWMMYHLQRMEPMIDTVLFAEWFYSKLSGDEKNTFTKLAPLIKEVAYTPPNSYKGADMMRMSPLDPYKITPEWLVRVKFSNGAARREVLSDIEADTGAFLAMLLMIWNPHAYT
jgi:hypothetical protein